MGTGIRYKIENGFKGDVQYINLMATKKDDFWESLARAGALIGGAWILTEILKSVAKKVYRCPSCHVVIQEKESPCHSCGVVLIWNP